jgi:hypothetical protein
MKRDMDLCREILQRMEEHPECYQLLPKIEGRSDEEVLFHVTLLREAGLLWSAHHASESRYRDAEVRGVVGDTMGRRRDQYRITWDGYEFLEAARSDTLWNDAKRKVATTTGALAFEFIRAVLIHHGKKSLGLQ